MSFTTRNLNDTCTFWGVTADGYDGFTFSAPTIIKCRWEERGELFMNTQGEQEVSNAVVHLASDVSLGGYLYHGESVALDPTSLSGTFRIKRFNKITALRSMGISRVAYL